MHVSSRLFDPFQLCEFSLESLGKKSDHKKGLFHVSICSKSEPDLDEAAEINIFLVLLGALPDVGLQF